MKEKNINKYLLACNNDLNTFKKMYSYENVSDEMKEILKNGLERITSYYHKTEDNRLFTTYEFLAIIDCLGRIENYEYRNAKVFIDTLKELENNPKLQALNISKDKQILFTLSRYFDTTFFKSYMGKRKIEDQLYDIYVWGASRERHISQLASMLYDKKEESKLNRELAIRKINKYIKGYNYYPNCNKYKEILLEVLGDFDYDADKLLSSMPDIVLIMKDLEVLGDKPIIPVSYMLYMQYLNGNKKLDGYKNDLGSYYYHDEKIKIPFTKQEFLNGIHNELQVQERFGKIR